ncbi:hypothetical protein ACIG56_17555 [Nocardia fusca]|uniref:hypothetical protein n=1 Tax=Nocardia fusca TaxID=941183 RepID=UPI0037C87734
MCTGRRQFQLVQDEPGVRDAGGDQAFGDFDGGRRQGFARDAAAGEFDGFGFVGVVDRHDDVAVAGQLFHLRSVVATAAAAMYGAFGAVFGRAG